MGDAERRRRRLRHHGEAGPPDGESAAGRAGRYEPVDAFAEGPTATTAAVHDGDGSRSRRGSRPAELESSDDGSRSRRGTRPAELESSDDGSRSRRGTRPAELESSDDGSRSRRGVRHAELESSEHRARRTGSAEEGERGLRGLVGSGSSQVSVTAALRARDAARPTDADLAEAEARVVIVRRNWVPREELPRPGR
ncbi:hypothetical protein GA0070621_3569 [Micromonospora narathiwatensis]|uniref:Uncharacterized protein n=1 Tax=Micromonospora narathiwatensis TaxID=299146 RepID=A0A1A9A0V8_9ACTN|nr:hypothetical protein GA0070621_3569 [Micromonospora narathiwatensis]